MGDLGAWLVRFGEIFDEIQNCGDAVTLSLETAFSAPMEVSCSSTGVGSRGKT